MVWYEYVLLIVLPLLAGSVLLLWQKILTQFQLSFLIAFTGGYLLTICLQHLLPETYAAGGYYAGILALAGFFFQYLLDQASAGVEHGHFHHGQGHQENAVYFGLALHSLTEGLPLGTVPENQFLDHHTHNGLFLAVLLHKVPEALAFVSFLGHTRKPKAYLLLFSFCLMSPLGAYFGWQMNDSALMTKAMPYLIAVIGGIFLHLSTSIIYETSTFQHKLKLSKVFVILLGILTALLTNI